MNEKLVYIVLINYNNSEDTIECVDSLSKIEYKNFKIIVVDNGSNENEKKKLSLINQKEIEIIFSENTGFSGGNNIGIKRALASGADFVCMLNNDTTVEPDFLSRLISSFDKFENVGMVCPYIYDYFNKNNYSYCSGYIDLYTARTLPETDADKFNAKDAKPRFATGCCLLIKKEVFETVGLWDEDYFLYFEDTDYSIRVGKKYRIILQPESIIYHKEAASTSKIGEFKQYYIIRNRLMFIKKNCSFVQKIHAYFFSIISFCIKGICGYYSYKIIRISISHFLKNSTGKY